MYCSQCGAKMPDNAKFCARCGAERKERSPGESPQDVNAPKPNPAPTASDGGASEPSVPRGAKPSGSHKGRCVFIACLAVLVLAAVGVGVAGMTGAAPAITHALAKIGLGPQAYEYRASQLFMQKIDELEKEYGEPEVKTHLVDGDGGDTLAFSTGLSYAELVDFGDGNDRLVVAYKTEPGDEGVIEDDGSLSPEIWSDSSDTYAIEIWEYRPDERDIVCVAGGDEALTSSRTAGTQGFGYYPLADGSSCSLATFADTDTEQRWTFHGLEEDGTFGTVLFQEVSYDENGDVAHRYLDGKEVSDGEFNDIGRSIFGDYQSDLLYGIMFVRQAATEEEALRGWGEVLGLQHMVWTGQKSWLGPQTVADAISDTKEELDRRLEGTADTEEQGAPVVARTVEIVASLPDGETSSTATMECLELLPDGIDDHVREKLNAMFKEDCLAVRDAAESGDLASSDESRFVGYSQDLTFVHDGIIGVRTIVGKTDDGVSTWTEARGTAYDIETGEEVAVWDAVDMTKDDLDVAAVDVIASYLGDVGDGGAASKELEQKARDIVSSGDVEYLLTDEGVTAFLKREPMTVGDEGSRADDGVTWAEVVVIPFGDEYDAGDEVTHLRGYFMVSQ